MGLIVVDLHEIRGGHKGADGDTLQGSYLDYLRPYVICATFKGSKGLLIFDMLDSTPIECCRELAHAP